VEIKFNCPGCGRKLGADEEMGGMETPCPSCNTVITIPPAGAAQEEAAPAATAEPKDTLSSMSCKGCGGVVNYEKGDGLFKCKFCGSVYESTRSADGSADVKTIKLIEQKLDAIEGHTQTTSGIATEERLQKKVSQIQDKIDYKYIEFANGPAKRLAAGSLIAIVVGVILALMGFSKDTWFLLLVGPLVVVAGVWMSRKYKEMKAAYEAEVAEMKSAELEPVYEQLRQKGAVLEGGAIAIGYTESTAVPMRYCVACHKNVTPLKAGGSGFAGLSGANLLLTIFTCGAWLPAWFAIEVLTRSASGVRRVASSGQCPQCACDILFPARIPNT
jgi:hypothetical protein